MIGPHPPPPRGGFSAPESEATPQPGGAATPRPGLVSPVAPRTRTRHLLSLGRHDPARHLPDPLPPPGVSSPPDAPLARAAAGRAPGRLWERPLQGRRGPRGRRRASGRPSRLAPAPAPRPPAGPHRQAGAQHDHVVLLIHGGAGADGSPEKAEGAAR